MTGFKLDGCGLIPGRGYDFSLCHFLQNSSGHHPTSCQMNTDHSPTCSSEIRTACGYTATLVVHFHSVVLRNRGSLTLS